MIRLTNGMGKMRRLFREEPNGVRKECITRARSTIVEEFLYLATNYAANYGEFNEFEPSIGRHEDRNGNIIGYSIETAVSLDPREGMLSLYLTDGRSLEQLKRDTEYLI